MIARIANNNKIWNFKGKYKTLNRMYNALSKVKHERPGYYGKIHYHYFFCVSYFLHLLNWSATTTMMEITIGMRSLIGGILCTSWKRIVIGIVNGFIACW